MRDGGSLEVSCPFPQQRCWEMPGGRAALPCPWPTSPLRQPLHNASPAAYSSFSARGPPPLKSRDLTPNAESLEARPLLEELGSKREGAWNCCWGGTTDGRQRAGMWGRTHVAAPSGL